MEKEKIVSDLQQQKACYLNAIAEIDEKLVCLDKLEVKAV